MDCCNRRYKQYDFAAQLNGSDGGQTTGYPLLPIAELVFIRKEENEVHIWKLPQNDNAILLSINTYSHHQISALGDPGYS